MAIAAERPLTVAALTQRIGDALGDFGTVAVQGELSQAKVAPSGHFYATLKDSEALIGLVMWRSTAVRQGPLPKEGTQVVVRGNLSVYGPRGQYQLTATRIEAVGAGDLAARLAAVKAKLLAEGLFDEERKRPLPFLPRAVGLATAGGSAALADLVHSIRTRFPHMPIVHAPCLVQGQQAVPSIIAALARLGRQPEVDVIICGRGGGSLEDLWAFNDEAVVRAIAAAPVPVISAVGHETDTTLADFVADVRAKTPTAAGELVVPIEADLREQLDEQRLELDRGIDDLLAGARERLAALVQHRALAGPRFQVDLRRQRLDELTARLSDGAAGRLTVARNRLALLRSRLPTPALRLERARERLAHGAQTLVRISDERLARLRERLAAGAAHLDALSPLAVIARGYSVVRTADGRLIRVLADAPPGTALQARLTDGWLDATVSGSRAQRLNEPESDYLV
jgi:exodeoxyribonuclease VII large subunit